MENLRQALTEADEAYLIGMSNKGTYKRALKDLENAEVSVNYMDDYAEVHFGGEVCKIKAPLWESSCSCPSRSVCRHLISAILWLKNNSGESEPTEEEPADSESADEEHVENEPTEEEPVISEPTDEEPVDGEPLDEEPAEGEPTDEEPLDGEPTEEEPADGELTDEAESSEDESLEEPQDLLLSYTEPITLTTPVANGAYTAAVVFQPGSGIPSDVELSVREIREGPAYDASYSSAVNTLSSEETEVRDFFLLDVSLVSGGVNYAADHPFDVTLVMNLSSPPEDIHVIQMEKGGAQKVESGARETNSGAVEITFGAS